MRINMKYLVLIFTGLMFVGGMNAQQTYSSKEALEMFKQGDYQQAQQAYSYLLKKYDREPKYNYYYGICLLQNNQNIPEAVKRLKYSVVKGVSRDAYYYLGRAYQLSYNFDEAINKYKRFLRYASASDIRNEKAELYIAQSEVAKRYSVKVYDLTVLSRDTVLKTNFLNCYRPVQDVGEVLRNEDFFESGIDPDGVLYLTERGDQVYFALASESGERDLYKMEKLLDGWSDSEPLTEINSEFDDMYPYLLIDGQTLFFSSNREDGLGGFDIYKSTYDSESKTFTSPVNVGMPFNSPKDDFLFVSDEFNNKAWFASNRETADSMVVVYGIKWDDTVVKNLVTNMNEVKEKAALSLADYVDDGLNGLNGHKSEGSTGEDQEFCFIVADTLVYTCLDHFNSEEAKAYFQESQRLIIQKDSLSDLMRSQRNKYAITNSDAERSKLVNNILALEKEVYGLDAKIEQEQNNARYAELNKIRELIRQGKYVAPDQVKQKSNLGMSLEEVLIPSEYSFYTNKEFERQFEKWDVMYRQLFNEYEIQQLKRADSLYVWGHILNLESSKLLEEASDMPAVKVPVISSPFKKNSIMEEEQSPVEGMIKKSKELKEIALKIYHIALDEKSKLFNAKINEVVKANPTTDFSFMEDHRVDADAYFRKAAGLMDPMMGYGTEMYEKAGTLKRAGVQAQEEVLCAYLDYKQGNVGVEDRTEPVATKTKKTYQELQGNAHEETRLVEIEKKSIDSVYEYRIQIGVFRNAPAAEALSKIPETTKVEIESKGLTKYFAGRYSSYKQASSDLERVRAAGFSGAFVVVFKEGKQINLTDDLKK